MSAEGSQHRRSSRRSSVSSTATTDHGNQSVHPVAKTLDANTIDFTLLKHLLAQESSEFEDRVDFVNLSDDRIADLFYSDRARKRDKGADVVYPSKPHRRTAKQIRQWFTKLGNKQRRDLNESTKDIEIVEDHDSTLRWNETTNKWTNGAELGEESPAVEDGKPPAKKSRTVCKCPGVNLHHIRHMQKIDDARREELFLGFKHTCREAFNNREPLSHPNNDNWRYTPPVVGVLVNGNDKKDVRWTVEEEEHSPEESQYEHLSIFARDCSREELEPGQSICAECQTAKKRLIERFDSQLDLRFGVFRPKTRRNILSRSGSLQKKHADYHKQQSANKAKKIARRDKIIDKLLGETGLDVKTNKASDVIFCDSVQEATKKLLSEKLSQNSIAAYAFARSVENHKKAKEKGAKAIRHCPLMIRLGAIVAKKLGHNGELFDLVAKIAGFPSSRTIRRYTTTNSNDPDGIMHGNCERARDIFDQKFPDADRFDWRRHVVLAFDSMHTKGRFGVSRNTNELVAIDEGAFEEDLIMKELNQLEENDKKDENEELKLPGIAKHFLVFIATTWSPEGKIQFLVARHGKKSLTGRFLAREIRDCAMALALYGFIVDQIASDGASENRWAFKFLATIDAKTILTPHFSETELRGLPLNFKIAFRHPHRLYNKKILIFIGGEMPHWVKKFRNAFDNKSRQLTFRGMRMELAMIYEIWLASGDADVCGGSALRRYHFTHDHYKLNAYLKMRVFLAVQIPSKTTIQMIKDYCAVPENLAKEEDYQPMIDLFGKVDRLVDIMNGTGFKKGKFRDVELINHPHHRHTIELFGILRLFEEWKNESGGFKDTFITKYTYEDLVWMVFGLAGVACKYLKKDGSNAIHQGRGGSDVCEHLFSRIRYINSNPNMQQAREGASNESSVLGMHNAAFVGKNKGNSGTAPMDVAAEDLLADLKPKSKASRKRKRD